MRIDQSADGENSYKGSEGENKEEREAKTACRPQVAPQLCRGRAVRKRYEVRTRRGTGSACARPPRRQQARGRAAQAAGPRLAPACRATVVDIYHPDVEVKDSRGGGRGRP